MNTALRTLMRRFFGYLFPRAVDPNDDLPVEPELREDPTEDDPDIETLGDEPGDAVDPEPGAAPRAARVDHERRAEEAAREAREAREAVAALQRQMQAPSNDPQRRVWEEEERQLADPNTDPQTKWQIQANRTLRESHQQSQMALARAADLADATDYNAKAIGNPLYAKFKDTVEKELSEWRAKGANPPRQAILERVVGRAVLEGKFKSKSAAKPIDRSKPNTPRSDVPARSGATDRDKRRARLENISI